MWNRHSHRTPRDGCKCTMSRRVQRTLPMALPIALPDTVDIVVKQLAVKS